MPPRQNCPDCEGSGMVPVPHKDGPHPPVYYRCKCVLREDILSNAERVMPGLTSAQPITRSPLADKWRDNVRITAPEKWFKTHLRHVAVRRTPLWSGRVISDADLITSWLASTALRGIDIIDPDAYAVSTEFLTLADLVIPPDLLIIRMGVKIARNSACPEVLSEAIQLRKHENLPTWVWDQPEHQLVPGHLFWSEDVGHVLRDFKMISTGVSTSPMITETSEVSQKPVRKTLR